jgi:DHA1 family multidrug resistance protein-like MFS transporter
MWLSGFALIFLIFFLPETSANNILYRRTVRLRKLTGDDKLKCEPELEGETMKMMDIVKMTLIRPITLNFLEPIVFLLNLYIALIYALLYCWFESFPIVFNEIYGWPLVSQDVCMVVLLLPCLITKFLYLSWPSN